MRLPVALTTTIIAIILITTRSDAHTITVAGAYQQILERMSIENNSAVINLVAQFEGIASDLRGQGRSRSPLLD